MDQVHAKITVVTLVCLAYAGSTNLRSYAYKRFHEMDSQIYSDGFLKKIQVKGKVQCFVRCGIFDNCNTVFYNSDSYDCRLYDHKLSGNKTEDFAGLRCWGVYWRCGPPPRVPNTDVSYRGIFPNSEAKYTCKTNFRLCTSQSRCQATGEWTPVTHRCLQYRWNNPVVPFVEALPCYVKHILHIKIQATSTERKVFGIHLKLGEKILFHAACRFRFLEETNQLVMNSKLNDRWATEYKAEGFPFTVNESFLMEIKLRSGIYELVVGSCAWSYQEKEPGLKPERLVINGSIRVELVEIIT